MGCSSSKSSDASKDQIKNVTTQTSSPVLNKCIGLTDNDVSIFYELYKTLNKDMNKNLAESECRITFSSLLKYIAFNGMTRTVTRLLALFNKNNAKHEFDSFTSFSLSVWNIGTMTKKSLGKYMFLAYYTRSRNVVESESLKTLLNEATIKPSAHHMSTITTRIHLNQTDFIEYLSSCIPIIFDKFQQFQIALRTHTFDDCLWEKFQLVRQTLTEETLFNHFLQLSPMILEGITVTEQEKTDEETERRSIRLKRINSNESRVRMERNKMKDKDGDDIVGVSSDDVEGSNSKDVTHVQDMDASDYEHRKKRYSSEYSKMKVNSLSPNPPSRKSQPFTPKSLPSQTSLLNSPKSKDSQSNTLKGKNRKTFEGRGLELSAVEMDFDNLDSAVISSAPPHPAIPSIGTEKKEQVNSKSSTGVHGGGMASEVGAREVSMQDSVSKNSRLPRKGLPTTSPSLKQLQPSFAAPTVSSSMYTRQSKSTHQKLPKRVDSRGGRQHAKHKSLPVMAESRDCRNTGSEENRCPVDRIDQGTGNEEQEKLIAIPDFDDRLSGQDMLVRKLHRDDDVVVLVTANQRANKDGQEYRPEVDDHISNQASRAGGLLETTSGRLVERPASQGLTDSIAANGRTETKKEVMKPVGASVTSPISSREQVMKSYSQQQSRNLPTSFPPPRTTSSPGSSHSRYSDEPLEESSLMRTLDDAAVGSAAISRAMEYRLSRFQLLRQYWSLNDVRAVISECQSLINRYNTENDYNVLIVVFHLLDRVMMIASDNLSFEQSLEFLKISISLFPSLESFIPDPYFILMLLRLIVTMYISYKDLIIQTRNTAMQIDTSSSRNVNTTLAFENRLEICNKYYDCFRVVQNNFVNIERIYVDDDEVLNFIGNLKQLWKDWR